MRILVNYNYDRSEDKYEILKGKYVLADLKTAILDTEMEINEPLVVPIRGIATVVDRASYEAVNRIFKLATDDKGNVVEHEKGQPIWLPKDTDLSKLCVINGQLALKEVKENENEKEPAKKETKPRPKPNKK